MNILSRIYHYIGLGCIVGNLIVMGFIYAKIYLEGAFIGYEPNDIIILTEVFSAAYGVIYGVNEGTKWVTSRY